jgi:phosphate/sulfate permease
MAVESIIVYHNPVEAYMWESGGYAIFAVFFLCGIIAVCITYWLSEKLPELFVDLVYRKKTLMEKRQMKWAIKSKLGKWFICLLITIFCGLLYGAHLYFA